MYKTISRLALCFGVILSSEIISKECVEIVKFKFDDRPWDKAYEDKGEKNSIVEFTLNGETVDNWSELVSVQRFPGLDVPMEKYYDEYMKDIRKTVKPTEVNSKVINKSPDSMLFEWWIDDKILAQHEWFRIMKTPSSMLVLRYTTKKMDDVPKVRDTWEKILSSATYVDEGDCKK